MSRCTRATRWRAAVEVLFARSRVLAGEVDLIAELGGGRLIGIEVKASGAPRGADARHLAWLREEIGDRFVAGIVLHTGPHVYELGDRIVAAPICTLWG